VIKKILLPKCINKTSFTATLDGVVWQFSLWRNFMDRGFYVDLYEPISGVRVRGIKLVAGIDLIEPYGLNDLGWLFLTDENRTGEDPTVETIESFYFLYFPRAA
jgi:hypothetical protein